MRPFPKTADRFVAFFDLMGFKDLIYRNTHDDVCKTMDFVCDLVHQLKSWEKKHLRKNDDAVKSAIGMGVVLPVVFSDSILFISRTNSIEDAQKAIYVSSFFLCGLLNACIPVKGALAYGTFTADFKKSNFFGRPLLDSYFLAHETHFYGAVLHHTFERYLREQNKEIPHSILKRKPIAMKSGRVTHSYIDWTYHLEEDTTALDRLLERFYEGVSGDIRMYVDNTRDAYLSSD